METTIITILVMILVFKLDQKLIIENLALRQQLAVMKQSVKRPKIRKRDRVFWVFLFRFWKSWRDALIIVKPETVIRWHRKGFKLFWTFKSRRRKPGRSPIDAEIKKLIQDIAKANPLWGAPRIYGELLKLGIDVSERTVSNIIKRYRPVKPPSQTWRTFLQNHMHNSFAIDFFTVPTATFNIIYVFVVQSHWMTFLRTTVGNVLKRNGIPPAPERKKDSNWSEFITLNPGRDQIVIPGQGLIYS